MKLPWQPVHIRQAFQPTMFVAHIQVTGHATVKKSEVDFAMVLGCRFKVPIGKLIEQYMNTAYLYSARIFYMSPANNT